MTEITQRQLDDYAAGKVELKDLVGIEPAHFEELKGRAQFFLDGGHHERALIMLEMIEELDRTDPLPSLLAVQILLARGESDAAEEKLERLFASCPDNPDVLVAKAELLIQIGQMAPAAELLAQVIDRDPNANTDATKRAQAVAAKANAMLESS